MPVPDLRIRYPVERVGERPSDLREQLELLDRQAGLAALRLRRLTRDADQVAQVEVEVPHAIALHEQLDLPAPVDEVEEDELPQVAPAHHPPRQAKALPALGSSLELVRCHASVRDGCAVWEPLGERVHGLRV